MPEPCFPHETWDIQGLPAGFLVLKHVKLVPSRSPQMFSILVLSSPFFFARTFFGIPFWVGVAPILVNFSGYDLVFNQWPHLPRVCHHPGSSFLSGTGAAKKSPNGSMADQEEKKLAAADFSSLGRSSQKLLSASRSLHGRWVWLKIKQEGLRRFWSMFPLPGFHFGTGFVRHHPVGNTPRLPSSSISLGDHKGNE